ncbi:hypothetical protein [Paenibacillus sp.]|uniref:hypothetical protein n=1 Tax=Paenibacillus sp. TaxID=58172 RepID=UPI002D360B52|nr:hypothetical protein [Paenibacillus sp.]HZG88082.1 hypothetical protein [Paenibacillus sp.]
MRTTRKEGLLKQGGLERSQAGVEARGAWPTDAEALVEFAAEPGSRPAFAKSGNPRVHKS